MKQGPKTEAQLAAELRPFLAGERNTCFSEISLLLKDILEYLEDRAHFNPVPTSDVTIKSQLELPLKFEFTLLEES